MRLRYVLMVFPLMLAGLCAVFGIQEYALSARSSQQPEETSLRDLIKRGPGGNPNIILKDFSIFEDYVYEKRFGEWKRVWVPIIPTGSDDVALSKRAIRAFLYSEDLRNDKEVRQRFGKAKLRCMVNPEAPKPGIIGSILIEKSYPGTKSSDCIIIEEGKEPASPLKLSLYAMGVAFFVGLCPFIWVAAWLFGRVKVEPQATDRNRTVGSGRRQTTDPILDALPADDDGKRRAGGRRQATEPILDVLPADDDDSRRR